MIRQHETIDTLARTHGLKRAVDLPRPIRRPELDPPRPEYVDETPKKPRRSELEARVEDELGHHWVAVLAYDRPMPTQMGDQHGMLPVWIEATAEWRRAGVDADRFSPAARVVRLIVVGVPSAEHALRLKTCLDEALKGRQDESEAAELRKRFRNAIDFGELDHWLTPLLQDALLLCELQATQFETFSREDHERMVRDRMTRVGGASVFFDPRRAAGRG